MKIILKDKSLNKVEEKIILINIIGVLESLKKERLSIDESEAFIFSPHMINKLKKYKCNENIIDILERGCELEDIASLFPKQLADVISELEEMAYMLMENNQKYDSDFWLEEQ